MATNKRTTEGAKSRGRRRKKSASGRGPSVDLGTDKLYFKIGEVSDIVGVPAYVLRYWETEFREINPQKSRSQQRVYRRSDVETLLRVKHLLYEQKFTIVGARKQLRERGTRAVAMAAPAGAYLARKSMLTVRAALDDLARELATEIDVETGTDPAAYVREMGGAQAVFAGAPAEAPAQPLLQRDGDRGADAEDGRERRRSR